MTDLPPEKSPKLWLTLLTALLAPFLIDSCSSTHKIEGLPDKLPDIALNGSNATPPHTLPGYEYPFDPSGNYVSAWAADGERRAGRSPVATDDDEKRWSSSHHGHVTASSKHSTKKGTKSGRKKSTSDDEDKPKSKSHSKKSSSKKGGSGKSTKKKSVSHDEADKPKSKSHSPKKSSKKKKSDD